MTSENKHKRAQTSVAQTKKVRPLNLSQILETSTIISSREEKTEWRCFTNTYTELFTNTEGKGPYLIRPEIAKLLNEEYENTPKGAFVLSSESHKYTVDFTEMTITREGESESGRPLLDTGTIELLIRSGVQSAKT